MDRAERVRQILGVRGLTLYRVSREAAQKFGPSSPFFIPHNFYSDLAHAVCIPSIEQVFALSQITNYRLADWLAVFGINLKVIPRLQLCVAKRRTTVLDSFVYDLSAWVPWFSERPSLAPAASVAPLTQLLAWGRPRRAEQVAAFNQKRFLYVRVGQEDMLALPGLAPGSIVRADPSRSQEVWRSREAGGAGRFFLVEYGVGFTCSRVLPAGKNTALLYSPESPCAQVEVHLDQDARILGMIDAELRPLGHPARWELAPQRVVPGRAKQPPASGPQARLGDLLRVARIRAGLSFREASAVSRQIAGRLSDELYFAAPSTLSDYETLSAPPRHIQKIITLCGMYGIAFREFLRCSGLALEQAGRDGIPDELVPREVPDRGENFRPDSGATDPLEENGFLDSLLRQWEEIPLFLRDALSGLTGLKSVTLSDVFWVGGNRNPLHPTLVNAALVLVNRRIKKARQHPERPACQQPLYLILKRSGGYLCGPCSLNDGNLVVPAYPAGSARAQVLRDGVDAEVIGQIIAILRRLA